MSKIKEFFFCSRPVISIWMKYIEISWHRFIPDTSMLHDPIQQGDIVHFCMGWGVLCIKDSQHLQDNIYHWEWQDFLNVHLSRHMHHLLIPSSQSLHKETASQMDMKKGSFGKMVTVLEEVAKWLPSSAPRASLKYGQNVRLLWIWGRTWLLAPGRCTYLL